MACAYGRGPRDPLVVALQAAEADPGAAARAWELLCALPTLRYRRLLATFGALLSVRR